MYKYEDERANLFTERGQVVFMAMRDSAQSMLRIAGAFKAAMVMDAAVAKLGAADTFEMAACLDRMVELKEIRRINVEDNGPLDNYFTVAWRRG